jgi:hypothetical protein
LAWVNPDFDIGRERIELALKDVPHLNNKTGEARLHAEKLARVEVFQRMQSLFMHSYRETTSAAVLQNKLLCNTALHRLGLPVLPVIWGAFGRHALGGYPHYSRASLCSALDGLGAAKEFVLKTVTDGMKVGVLLMTQARWEAEGWTCERVAVHMERYVLPQQHYNNTLSGWYSRWGVIYEQRGLMLQRPGFDLNFKLCAHAVVRHPQRPSSPEFCQKHPLAVASVRNAREMIASGAFFGELKVHVAFGSLVGSGGMYLPLVCPPAFCYKNIEFHREPLFMEEVYNASRDGRLHVDADSEPTTKEAATANILHHTAQMWVSKHLDQLQSIASAIFNATGIDWFRLDTFIVPPRHHLVINEIEYPGGNTPPLGGAVIPRWLETYRSNWSGFRDPRRPNGRTVMELARVDPEQLTTHDYMSMHRPKNLCFWASSAKPKPFSGLLSDSIGRGNRMGEVKNAIPMTADRCSTTQRVKHGNLDSDLV